MKRNKKRKESKLFVDFFFPSGELQRNSTKYQQGFIGRNHARKGYSKIVLKVAFCHYFFSELIVGMILIHIRI